MTVGTKSVLYGAHQFAIHPWFVAWSWWKLWGFGRVYIGYRPGYPGTLRWRYLFGFGGRGGPVFAHLCHPLLWLSFFVHDLGYLGKPDMDGDEGERHVELGARILERADWMSRPPVRAEAGIGPWAGLCLFHSRFYAKLHGRPFSPLCVADKLAIAETPAWLYLPMVRATGEINEYMRHADDRNLVTDGQRGGKYTSMRTRTQEGEAVWYADVQDYVRRWVAEHKDGRQDTWTPAPARETGPGPQP